MIGGAWRAARLARLIWGAGSPPVAAEDPGPPPLPLERLFGGPFDLVDHTGRPVTDTDFHGGFTLLFFGYTFCPDICPTNLHALASAVDLLGPEGVRVTPVFVTVDPERDTPALMAGYVGAFHPRMVGLTGSNAQVARIVKAYRIHRVKVPLEDVEPGFYLVDHSSITYLLGPDGAVRTIFPHDTDAPTMAARMRSYLAAEAF